MIRFNDIPDKDLGIRVLKDYVDPQLETQDKVIRIPGRDGAYYFGNDLVEKVFYFPMFLERQATKQDLHDKIQQLKEIFFDGYGKAKPVTLVFDDQPDREYTVRYTGWLSIEKIATMGRFTMRLTAFDPYAQHTVSTENIIMDSDTSVLSEVLLGAQYEFNITTPQTIQVHNFSYYNIRPTIEIQGSFNSLTLTANSKSFSFGPHSGTIEVVGQNYTVLVDGQGNFSAMTGDFLEFHEGYNNVQISGTGLDITLTFKFKPKYL